MWRITNGIIKIASNISRRYAKAKVFVSQLPPRNDNLNWISQNVNNLMKHSLPESLYLVDNSNITTKMLVDKKHIREDNIGMLVYNMKKAVRRTLNNRNNEQNMKHDNRNNDKCIKSTENINATDYSRTSNKSKMFQMMDTMKNIINQMNQ